jgi:hypothetical protein
MLIATDAQGVQTEARGPVSQPYPPATEQEKRGFHFRYGVYKCFISLSIRRVQSSGNVKASQLITNILSPRHFRESPIL